MAVYYTCPISDSMGELELIREWYSYNRIVRRKYLDAMKGLSVEQLNRDIGASYPSLIRIYCHVLDAYNYWFECVCRLHDGDSKRDVWHPGISLHELESETAKTESVVDSVISGATEGELRNSISWTRTRDGKKDEHHLLLRDIAWHMVEEELQHRGELNALMWQMDVDPPQTAWDEV